MNPIVLVSVPLAGLLSWAFYRKKVQKKGVLTPEREAAFENAMNRVLDSTQLRKLASAFEGEGLAEQASLLRKRAALRDLPKDVKQKRRDIFKRALASKNKKAVLETASAFEGEGCIGVAEKLREYAEGLSDDNES